MGPGPDETHSLGLGVLIVAIEVFAVGSDIHVKNGLFKLFPGGVLRGHQSLLHGVHAADAGAVAVVASVGIARTYTLNPGDPLRLLLIGRTGEVSHARPAGREKPLVFEAGDNIGDGTITVNIQSRGVEGFEAGGQDDGAYIKGERLLPVLEIDGARGAEFFTGLAFAAFQVNAALFINGILEGHGLPVLDESGPALAQPHVELVIHFAGAFLRTQPAGNAFVHVDVAGVLPDGDGEISGLTREIDNFRQGQEIDIEMAADLDQLG